MSTKVSVLKNFAAGSVIQVSNVVIRLLQVPILISYLGLETYGQWLIIFSFPMFFSMMNFGFGSVAANDIAMYAAAGNLKAAVKSYSTALIVLSFIGFLGIALIILIVPFYNWAAYIGIHPSHQQEIIHAVIFLGISVFISLPNELFSVRMRAAKKAHLSIFWGGIKSWYELLALFTVLQFTSRFDMLALSYLLSVIIYIFVLQKISLKFMPDLIFRYQSIHKAYIKTLISNGMYFQILSVGNVLQNQGMLFIIQGALGPIQVAIFSTVRTIANVINQMMGFINQITWLEFNILLGEGNLKNAARLHRIGTLIQYFIASIGFIAVLIVGPQLIKLWTNGNIIIDRQLLLLFLLIIPLSASYACSAAVLASVNQIKMQAWLLLIGTIIGLVLCWILISHFGLYGAAFSTTPVYLISFYYVFKHALKITGDNRKDFIVGLKSEFIYGITVLKRKRYN